MLCLTDTSLYIYICVEHFGVADIKKKCYVSCTQGSPVEIQTSTQWKLIGHSMTATPSVLSRSSILPLSSSLGTFITARKNSVCAPKKVIISIPFCTHSVRQKLSNFQLRQTVPAYCGRTFYTNSQACSLDVSSSQSGTTGRNIEVTRHH